MMTETRKQKYPDGDCRRRFGGTRPVRRATSNGRGHGPISASVHRATSFKDFGGAHVVPVPNRPGHSMAVDFGGAALFGSLAMMVLARFGRGRGR